MIASRLGRAYGPGTLRKIVRGGGRALWVLDYRDGTGRRVRQALSSDKHVAGRLRADLINKRDLQLAGLGTIEGQSMPLAELRDLYLADLETRVGAKQLRNVKDGLTRILAWLPATRVRDVRVADVLRYRAQRLKDGVSNRTANLDGDSLKAMLAWGVTAGLIAENPLRALKRLPMGEKHQRHVRRALSDDEIERFLAATAADDARLGRQTPRVPQAPLWRALIETGARWGELTSVTWADLDPDRQCLTLRATTTKSGRSRVIPLRQELLDELLALRAIHQRVRQRVVQPGDRVLLSPEGAHWDAATTGARRLFRRVLEAAGINRIDAQGRVLDIHALRHTAASRMARRGVSLVVAQRVLGHSDPKLTARVYTHLELEDLRAAVEFSVANPRPTFLRADL